MKFKIAGKFIAIWNSEIVQTAKQEWLRKQKEIILVALERSPKNPVEYLLRKYKNAILQQGRWLAYSTLYAYIEGKNTALRFERFRDRLSITRGQYERLWKAFRHKFFWLSLINDVKTIEKIKNSLDEAIEDGIPRTKWIEQYLDDLEGKKFYAETIFRTNLTSHYNLGIMDAYDTEYFEYSAILDDRTTDICRDLHGKILTRQQTHLLPPNHFNCRSVVVPTLIPIGEPANVDEIIDVYKQEYGDFLYKLELVEIPPHVWETIREYVSRDLIEEVNRKLRELLENGD